MAANDVQHGGNHYAKPIQVWDFIAANGIPYLEGNAIKYLSRWRNKGGVEDLKKAKHYVEKLIELEEAAGKSQPVPFEIDADCERFVAGHDWSVYYETVTQADKDSETPRERRVSYKVCDRCGKKESN
ncbi:MAG: DUF3310 domain-containing protein [Fimbriiglobus sp.]